MARELKKKDFIEPNGFIVCVYTLLSTIILFYVVWKRILRKRFLLAKGNAMGKYRYTYCSEY